MADIKNRASAVKLVFELIEQSIVLFFLELKLGALEIKHNIKSAENGAVFLGLGGFLLLFSLLGLMAAGIAALALVLPVWLSALIVSAVLILAGGALLFMGLSKLKHFTLIPRETVDRVENISKKLKHHAEERARAEHEAHERAAQEVLAREAARQGRREAREARETERRARARELTYARQKAREAAREERHRKAS